MYPLVFVFFLMSNIERHVWPQHNVVSIPWVFNTLMTLENAGSCKRIDRLKTKFTIMNYKGVELILFTLYA